MIKHKKGKSNVVANDFSGRHALLNFLNTQYLGFDYIKEIYKDGLQFSTILQECSKGAHKEFFIHEGFLFKGKDFVCPKGL